MKKEIRAENIPFLDSINYIDDKYIAEVLADVKLPKDADDGRLRRAWKQIAVLAACAVILGALFPVVTRLIGRSQIDPGGNPGSLPTAEASRVVRNGSQIWGDEAFINYLSNLEHYVPESGVYERLYEYDRDDASVPYRRFEVLSQIIDGKLYFIYDYRARVEDDENLNAAYLDLSTLEITDICDMTYDRISGGAYVCGDYYYYSRRTDIPARAGKLYRISLKDGREELVLEFAQEESLFMAADGEIVTLNRFGNIMDSETPKNCVINAYDIETLEKRVLWSDDGSKYRNVSSSAYLDGDLYFLAMHSDYSKYDIIRVNIESGKAECILEGISDHWWLTDGGIWYYPCEPRTVNFHPPFSSMMNSLFSTIASPTLHFCDLDGENDREIYTNADIAFENPRSAVIVDGKICGYFCGSFPSLGLDSALVLAEIDLETGEITALDDPSWVVTSSETEPPETEEEFAAPIPEGGLDFIEHVGEVPEEFKKIVEDDLFSGATIYGDILLTYRNGDNNDLIRILDKSGKVMGEIVIDEPLSSFYRSIQCSDGNFIAFVDTRDSIYSATHIKLVKFDKHGKVLFDNDYQYSRDVFQNIVEVDDGFICIGTCLAKTDASKRSQNDIAVIKLSSDGRVENYIEFGGNDYDTIHHVEKTGNGARLYFVMREQGEKKTSSWLRYDFDSDLNITKRTEITENDVPDEDDPRFTIDGKPYDRYEDFFPDYSQKDLFYTIIEYDDFVIAIYNRFTSTMTFREYMLSSSFSPLSYYTEKVYAAYTKQGKLIWRTAFDTTNYEMLKEYYGE